MKRRLTLAIGCLACATSAVSAAPSAQGPARTRDLVAGCHAPAVAIGSPITAISDHPDQALLKTYLIYQKSGRPLRVEAETIGFVRDGVVVLHNPEGQPIAVIPVTETGGIIEERAVIQGEEPAQKPRTKASAKAEPS